MKECYLETVYVDATEATDNNIEEIVKDITAASWPDMSYKIERIKLIGEKCYYLIW